MKKVLIFVVSLLLAIPFVNAEETTNENSNILILQTCSFDNTESGSNYLLVMGVLQ